jgi:hypothetical protein
MNIALVQFTGTEKTGSVIFDTSFVRSAGTAKLHPGNMLEFSTPPQNASYLVELGNSTRFQKGPARSRLKLVREKTLFLEFEVRVVQGPVQLQLFFLQYDSRGKRVRSTTIPHRQHGFRDFIRLGKDAASFALAMRLLGTGSIALGAVCISGGAHNRDIDWSEAVESAPVRLSAGLSKFARTALGPDLIRVLRRRKGDARKDEKKGTAQTVRSSGNPPPSDRTVEVSGVRSLRELQELNSHISSLARESPGAWIAKELEFALRFECYETAGRLVKFAQAIWPQIPARTAELIGPLLMETFAASGANEEARAFLKMRASAFAGDDKMAAIARTTEEGDFDPAARMKLPSGRLDAYSISRNAARCKTQLRRLLADEPGLFARDPQNYLLPCSAAAGEAPEQYRAFMNRFLAGYGAEKVASVEFSENILRDIRFETGAPINDGPLVSIIMSAYNAEGTVDYAIRSILGQTYRNIELLVCDDRSADSTVKKILTAANGDPRVRVFKSKRNQGTYNIRNQMLQQAGGEYVTFQDSDDLALPSRIAATLKNLQAANATAAVAHWIRIRASGEVVFFRDQAAVRASLVSILAKKDAFLRYGPYRSVRFGGDTEFKERIRINEGDAAIQQLNQPVLFGLWSTASLTQSAGSELLENGYRGEARRCYAEATTRQRLLGSSIVPEDNVMHALKESNVAIAPSDIKAVTGGRP